MLSADRLRDLLSYDPETGQFRWRVSRGTAKAGNVAGTTRLDGYVVIRLLGKLYYAHRLAWLYMTGEWPSDLLDHRDLEPGDNRWATLRLADKSKNSLNTGVKSTNSTGFKGVSVHRKSGKYRAQIVVAKVRHHLGLHDTAEQAHQAYVAAAERLAGEFARAA